MTSCSHQFLEVGTGHCVSQDLQRKWVMDKHSCKLDGLLYKNTLCTDIEGTKSLANML